VLLLLGVRADSVVFRCACTIYAALCALRSGGGRGEERNVSTSLVARYPVLRVLSPPLPLIDAASGKGYT